ncbi:hypothetical protein E2562_013153 [Oryza meyeriana var. granulata]|uniref:Uncharacterized protein n=1 Tax=Oryza meyeriana var. granulata TaxID=110450 RepID=A0A6G1F808_9ORYZ|nr:hypothetical protein E2562_013153 [Oryza meyeriana var. granulata]
MSRRHYRRRAPPTFFLVATRLLPPINGRRPPVSPSSLSLAGTSRAEAPKPPRRRRVLSHSSRAAVFPPCSPSSFCPTHRDRAAPKTQLLSRRR